MSIRTKNKALLLSLLLASAAYLSAIGPGWAGPPRTMPGPCGSVLPKNSVNIGKNRYHVTYHRALSGIFKMYRKVYGKNNPQYRMTKLFALSDVIAYHLKSNKQSTGWSGLNIAFYTKRKHSIQIFVICRK